MQCAINGATMIRPIEAIELKENTTSKYLCTLAWVFTILLEFWMTVVAIQLLQVAPDANSPLWIFAVTTVWVAVTAISIGILTLVQILRVLLRFAPRG